MLIKILLIVAIVIQTIATLFAIRLIRTTKYNSIWILFTIGFTLLSVERVVQFLRANGQTLPYEVFVWLGLVISISMSIGVMYAHKLFKYIARLNRQLGLSVEGVTEEVIHMFQDYSWPGNIRELENVLENAVALSESELIYAEHIHLEGTAPAPLTLKERLKREERQILRQTLAQCGGSRVKAMELLGLSKTVFYGKLKEYQLD